MKNYSLTAICVAFLCTLGIAQSPSGKAHLTVPNTPGLLELDTGDARVQQRIRPDGKEAQLKSINEKTGLIVSAFLQRVGFPASAAECRKQWWGTSKEPPGMHWINVKLSEAGSIARVDYDVPEFQGQRVDQHSVHAYLGGGTECAEVHVSKVKYKAQDDQLFSDFLSAVRFIPDAHAETSVLDLFQKGSKSYLEQNYKMAAQFYQQALDIEKQKRSLDRTYFRVLVDNLGMSYGIGGDLQRAKTTFEYGISQDETYPLFYYNMACTYGEMSKRDEALDQLRRAYQLKANVIPGESVPDPLKDDSFRMFVSDKKFLEAVHAMQRSQ